MHRDDSMSSVLLMQQAGQPRLAASSPRQSAGVSQVLVGLIAGDGRVGAGAAALLAEGRGADGAQPGGDLAEGAVQLRGGVAQLPPQHPARRMTASGSARAADGASARPAAVRVQSQIDASMRLGMRQYLPAASGEEPSTCTPCACAGIADMLCVLRRPAWCACPSAAGGSGRAAP